MRHDERALVSQALQRARRTAYGPGEFVDQQSFMRASEILSLAAQTGIEPGVSVLDLCCGVAGPGRLITRELGCTYAGVDASPTAIDIARAGTGDLACRFEVSRVPPLPAGPFDVVLLLETMLAFADKETLLHETCSALADGGRFAFTLEEGLPLTEAERRSMPASDTVWLTPLPSLLSILDRAGMRVRWQDECSRSHLTVVDALVTAIAADKAAIAAQIGGRALDEMLTAHRLWSRWLRKGRVRKFAFVVEKAQAP